MDAKVYGNDNETVAVVNGKIWLVSSVDWTEETEPEELSEVPAGLDELSISVLDSEMIEVIVALEK